MPTITNKVWELYNNATEDEARFGRVPPPNPREYFENYENFFETNKHRLKTPSGDSQKNDLTTYFEYLEKTYPLEYMNRHRSYIESHGYNPSADFNSIGELLYSHYNNHWHRPEKCALAYYKIGDDNWAEHLHAGRMLDVKQIGQYTVVLYQHRVKKRAKCSTIAPKDIEIVMQQAGCCREKAVEGLKFNDGDIVNTIMNLT